MNGLLEDSCPLRTLSERTLSVRMRQCLSDSSRKRASIFKIYVIQVHMENWELGCSFWKQRKQLDDWRRNCSTWNRECRFFKWRIKTSMSQCGTGAYWVSIQSKLPLLLLAGGTLAKKVEKHTQLLALDLRQKWHLYFVCCSAPLKFRSPRFRLNAECCCYIANKFLVDKLFWEAVILVGNRALSKS